MIKGIILDMDGVIINTEPLYIEVEKEMFADYGIPFREQEIYPFMGRTTRVFWQHFLTAYNITTLTLDDAIHQHRTLYLNKLKTYDQLEIIKGLEDWLIQLKARDIPVVIASSSAEEIVATIVKQLQLMRYVKGYISGDSVENSKPSPDIFIKAAQLIGVSPENCIVVEDSENGLLAAQRAGMKRIAYSGVSIEQNHENADYRISEYTDETFKIMTGLIEEN